MKIGDRVIVDASALGDGIDHVGVIDGIEEFLHHSFVTVQLDKPAFDDIYFITLFNLDLIKVINDYHIKVIEECL